MSVVQCLQQCGAVEGGLQQGFTHQANNLVNTKIGVAGSAGMGVLIKLKAAVGSRPQEDV